MARKPAAKSSASPTPPPTAPAAPAVDPAVYSSLLVNSLAFYAAERLRGPSEPPYNGRCMIAQHHQEWSDLINQYKKLCLVASRDHGKSYMLSKAYPLWMAEKFPNEEGLLFCATERQARRTLSNIIKEVETNPKLQHLVPKRKLRWSADAATFSTGFTIFAYGYGTRARGAHARFAVVDDTMNDEIAYSVVLRDRAIDYFYNAITPMVVPGGQTLVVGCVGLDTIVPTHNGLRTIRSVCPGELKPQTLYPLHLPVYGRDGWDQTSHFWVNGECETRKVTTSYGFTLECSDKHPVLTMGEDGVQTWKKSPDLREGDFVAVQSNTRAFGPPVTLDAHAIGEQCPTELTYDLAYLVGLWTAEGSYETSGRVAISNTDAEIRSWLATHPFGLKFKPSSPPCEHTMRAQGLWFLRLIEWLGGKLGTAAHKIVPEKILAADERTASAFLRGLFDGDGCASDRGTVQFGTVSETLAKTVHVMLLNMGIVSSLYQRPETKPTTKAPHPNYRLWMIHIAGSNADRFRDQIGFGLTRKQDRLDAVQKQRIREEHTWIPHQTTLLRKLRTAVAEQPTIDEKTPINVNQALARRSVASASLRAYCEYAVRRGVDIGDHEALVTNLNDVENGRVWVRVESVEKSTAFTVDFVVPKSHSFVSNGIVSHNTPFCYGDIYTALERDPLYYFAKYPAITDGKALWPERYPLALLEQTRISMGNLRFSREFLVTPVSDDAALFPDDLFRGAPVEQPDIRFGKDWRWWNKYGIVSVFMGVDFGFSPTSTGDFTVVFVVGVNKAGDRWVIDIIRDRGMSYGSQQALIVRTATKYKPDLIFVESNQAQRIFGDELKKNTDLPIVNYHTGGEKNSFEEGVPSLRLLLENKKYRIPRGDAPTIELTEQWITEMKSFTMVGGKCVSVGEHDDIAMASWLAEQACRSSQFDFAFGPQEGDEEAYQAMVADMQRADDVEMEFYSIPGSGTRRGGRSLLEDGDEHLEPTDDELIADHHNLSERARAVRNVRKRRDDDPHFLGFSILDIIPKG